MIKDFELVPHTADMKLRVYGTTLQNLFRNALVGMFQAVAPQAQGCVRRNERTECISLPERHEIKLHSLDRESLLVDFLSEALYLSDSTNEAYLDVAIHHMDDQHITATLHGIKITGFEVVEIKAVTYHDLKIIQSDTGWQADIVFDI